MRTLKPLALSVFISTLALAACQARTATSLPATSAPLPTVTARIIVVTATNPVSAYPGPAATSTAPAPTLSVTQAAAATQSAFATESAPFQPTIATQGVPTQAPTPVPATRAASQAAPTPDPNERVGGLLYQDLLDGSSRWNWGFQDEAAAFGLEDGHLKAVASQSGAYWRFTLGPDTLTTSDQQVTVAAHTVACGPSDAFGLVFRAAPQADTDGQFNLYAFEVNCGGQARFESLSGSHATPLVGWTNTTALNIGPGADNTLQVWMAGGEFRFYANGRYLFSAHDERLAAGTYGFYLQAGAQPGLTVNFDNLMARSVAKS